MRRTCAVAVLLASCFTSDPGDRRFPCDPLHGCPPGQTCVGELCQTAAAQDDASTAENGDLAAPNDLATGQCVGSGYPVGAKGVWACLGTFGPAKPASSLCRNRLCSDIATLVTSAECGSLANPVVGVAGSGQGAFNAFQSTPPSGERSDSTRTKYNICRLSARPLARTPWHAP